MGELLYRQRKGDKEKTVQSKIDRIFKETKKLKSEIEKFKGHDLAKPKKKNRRLIFFKRKNADSTDSS